jgi:hypothetical protein
MTRWGVLLLAAYVVLGLSPIEQRTAVRYAVGITVIVLAGVTLKHTVV